MIRNLYNQIPHLALKTKREITKYINWQQFTKGTRGKPNEQFFPKRVVIQLPKIYKYITNIIADQKYKKKRTARTSYSIKILGGGA